MPRLVTLDRVFIHPVVFTPPTPVHKFRTWLSELFAALRHERSAPAAHVPEPEEWEVVRRAHRGME